MAIFRTINDDGSAEFTISVGEEDHRFSVSEDGENAFLSYDETLSERAQLRVKRPKEEVVKRLIQSNEMTEYLESQSLSVVRRETRD